VSSTALRIVPIAALLLAATCSRAVAADRRGDDDGANWSAYGRTADEQWPLVDGAT
jgi:hypothetical protein